MLCPITSCFKSLTRANARLSDLDNVHICRDCRDAYREYRRDVYHIPRVRKSLFPFRGAVRKRVYGFVKNEYTHGYDFSKPMLKSKYAPPTTKRQKVGANKRKNDSESDSSDNGSEPFAKRARTGNKYPRFRAKQEANLNVLNDEEEDLITPSVLQSDARAFPEGYDEIEAERDQLSQYNARLLSQNMSLRVEIKRLRKLCEDCENAMATSMERIKRGLQTADELQDDES